MDYFTKLSEGYSVPDEEAKIKAEVLMKKWVSRFRASLQIHVEQETVFISAVFKELYQIFRMGKNQKTPLHSQLGRME